MNLSTEIDKLYCLCPIKRQSIVRSKPFIPSCKSRTSFTKRVTSSSLPFEDYLPSTDKRFKWINRDENKALQRGSLRLLYRNYYAFIASVPSSVNQHYGEFPIFLLLETIRRSVAACCPCARCVCEVRFIAWWGSWMSLGKSIEILVWYSVLHSETPPWTIVLCPPLRRTIPHCYFCLHYGTRGKSPNNGSLSLCD